jgi:hypothetical protein
MEIERETVVEAAVSIAGVFVFIAAVTVVGTRFNSNGGLTATGGLAMLGAIVLFVLVMAGVGVWLAGQD